MAAYTTARLIIGYVEVRLQRPLTPKFTRQFLDLGKSLRQAYDYWQDQPGSIPVRRRHRMRLTDAPPRGAGREGKDGDGRRTRLATNA